jgi:single-stranded-DNA-specific exonuclease
VALRLVDQIGRLEPFGRENPEPVFVTRGAMVLDPRRMGREGATFGMHVRLPGTTVPLKAVWFGSGDWAERLSTGDEVDIAYTPRINEWNGRGERRTDAS